MWEGRSFPPSLQLPPLGWPGASVSALLLALGKQQRLSLSVSVGQAQSPGLFNLSSALII